MDKMTSGQSAPIVELRDVTKRYPDEMQPAVDTVSLRIQPGSFSAIVGPSGAGKSTLLHLMGLLDRPTSGDVFLMGTATSRLDENRRALLRNGVIGFIFQFHFLLPDLTVYDNVLLPLLIRRDSSRDVERHGSDALRSTVEEHLDRVGLLKNSHKKPFQLSGGERQRVAVARALIAGPRLILADEPTGNLDSGNARSIWQLLRKANEDRGTAVVCVTHNEELAAAADTILRFRDGTIVETQSNDVLVPPASDAN